MLLIGYLAFGAAFYSWLFLRAEVERGEPCLWSKWAGRVGLLFVVAVLLAMLSGCDRSIRVWGDPAYIVTDASGCQYITTWREHNTGYGETPRLDRDGKQVCK